MVFPKYNLSKDTRFNMHDVVMQNLRDKLSNITPLLQRHSCVYIDFPVYFNIGDLLINIGTEEFFKDHSIQVASRFDIHELGTFDQRTHSFEAGFAIGVLDRLAKADALFILQGGGNVGDLWPLFQAFREMLLRRYPDTRFVQLPQSIHFRDPANQERSAAAIRRHGGVTFFVRDRESLPFATEECGCTGGLMPDMAHQLWKRKPVEPTWGTGESAPLYQRRHDKETTESAPGGFDWDDLIQWQDHLARKLYRGIEVCTFPLHDHVRAYRVWYAIRDSVTRRSIAFYAGHSEIHTDRLHGMILACLLAIPVKFTDNSYKKLTRYYEMWLKDTELVVSERVK
jgi:pyruvyl transferase EpsO